MAIDAPSSSDAALVEMWRNNLRKSQRAVEPPVVRPATVMFEWVGGGAPIVLANADPVLVEVPFPCRIVWAHMYAGDAAGNPVAVSATVQVLLTSFLSFGAGTALSGTGLAATLTSASKADLSLTGWQINLTTTDTMIGRLASFSGAATWIVLALLLRPTEVPIGVSGVINGADTLIDADGNTLVLRS